MVCEGLQVEMWWRRLGAISIFAHESLPEYPAAEAARGRYSGFPRFNVLAGGPGSLAERSATRGAPRGVSGLKAAYDRGEPLVEFTIQFRADVDPVASTERINAECEDFDLYPR